MSSALTLSRDNTWNLGSPATAPENSLMVCNGTDRSRLVSNNMKDIDPTRNKRQVLCIGVSVAFRFSGLKELTASTEMEMVSGL